MICLDKERVGRYVAKHCQMVWTTENSEAIGLLKGDELVAGVWYEDFNQKTITCHIAITGRMNREYLGIIFDFPFVQLGVDKIVCPVLSDNDKSIRLVKNMGFEEQARLLDVSPSGDMLFFVMSKDKCRFLGEKYGQKNASSCTT